MSTEQDQDQEQVQQASFIGLFFYYVFVLFIISIVIAAAVVLPLFFTNTIQIPGLTNPFNQPVIPANVSGTNTTTSTTSTTSISTGSYTLPAQTPTQIQTQGPTQLPASTELPVTPVPALPPISLGTIQENGSITFNLNEIIGTYTPEPGSTVLPIFFTE